MYPHYVQHIPVRSFKIVTGHDVDQLWSNTRSLPLINYNLYKERLDIKIQR